MTADDDGLWRVPVESRQAGGPFALNADDCRILPVPGFQDQVLATVQVLRIGGDKANSASDPASGLVSILT